MITFSQLGSMGQFGNQIWQYAFLCSLANRRGYEAAIPKRTHLPKRAGQYELGVLNVQARELTASDLIAHRYSEPSLFFDPAALEQPDGTDFAGYFQSWRYLDDLPENFADELRPQRQFAAAAVKSLFHHKKEGKRVIGVNVRRGDYLTQAGGGYHLVLPAEWYVDAVRELDDGHTQFIGVSDDPQWCMYNLTAKGDNRFICRSGNHYIADWALLSFCDGLIGSASSFSWWAAWMIRRRLPGAPVIFPAEWYGPRGPAHDVDDILPEGWLRREIPQGARAPV